VKYRRWSLSDTVEAHKQGWAPFDHDGVVFIEKLEGEHFKSDDEALEYVRQKAKAGDEHAQRALALCNLRDS
jgi:hypothetical protein